MNQKRKLASLVLVAACQSAAPVPVATDGGAIPDLVVSDEARAEPVEFIEVGRAPWATERGPYAMAVDGSGTAWVADGTTVGRWDGGNWEALSSYPSLPAGEDASPRADDLAIGVDGGLVLAHVTRLSHYDGVEWRTAADLDSSVSLHLSRFRGGLYCSAYYGSEVVRLSGDEVEVLDTLAYSTAPVWEVDDRLYAYDYDEIIQWSGEDFGDSSSWSAAPDPGVPFFMSDAHGLGDAVWAIGHSGQVVVLEGDSVGIETPSSDAPVLFKTVWAAADEVFVGGDDGVVLHRHRNTDWQTVPIPSSERITRIRGDGAGRVFALDGDGALFELVRE